ncbi:MAG TPA: DEAD/DEAH box helicase [bacterium]|nr:DEAD/DEAH box helicase [bacterium]
MSEVTIDQLPLPPQVKEVMYEKHIEKLWPPQVESIKAGLLDGESMTVSAPTSSGKTLIAELMITKVLLEKGGKALYLVPLRALAAQKLEELKKWERLGIRVASSTGDFDRYDKWLADYDIVVLTYEKCDSILRRRATESWVTETNVVVADEVHLVGDRSRGPTLEVVLTRLKKINPEIRFLSLSATISNAAQIARWLSSKLVVSDWRPVPLRQGVYYGGIIHFDTGERVNIKHAGDEPVVDLALDSIGNGGQVLVFASTRRQAESVAKKFTGKLSLSENEKKELNELAKKLGSFDELGPTHDELVSLIKSGVAFHHAGLSFDARTTLEQAFMARKVKVLASTTTLAAGLNLPARRVIIYDVTRYEQGFGRVRIPVLEYHQMAGRAGRPGLDPYGEAVLIARKADEVEELLEEYVRSKPEPAEPQLLDELTLLPHVLSNVTSGYAADEQKLREFFSQTFSGTLSSKPSMWRSISRSLKFLLDNSFLTDEGGYLLPTAFGKKTSEVYFHPYTAILVQRAADYAVSGVDRHSLHLVCLSVEVPKPRLAMKEKEDLSYEIDQEEDELPVSLEEYVETMMELSPDPYEEYLSAWKAAKVLEWWVNEVSEAKIEEAVGVQPGDLYQLYTTASWVSRGIASLFQTLKSDRSLVKAYTDLSVRLESGVKSELLPLVGLRGIGRVRARQLYNSGIRTLRDVAEAPIEKLTQLRGVTTQLALSIKEQASKLSSSV